VVVRNLHRCIFGLVYFLTLKNILATDNVTEIVSLCVLEKKDKNSSMNYVNSKIGLLKSGNAQVAYSFYLAIKEDHKKHNKNSELILILLVV
jgi:hypothetical protein